MVANPGRYLVDAEHPEKTADCARCGGPFVSRYWVLGRQYNRFCEACGLRNLHDGLGLPTPPQLIDPHSLRPTLSQREFQAELRK